MAVPNLSEIVTTTIANRSRSIADNVTANNALLTKLKMRGRIKTFSGGYELREELSFQENQTYKRYSGYEVLDISPTEVLTSAVFPIRQAAVAVTISGLEELQNSGTEQMIDLLESRMEVAESTMQNGISGDIYSNGTASGGKQINGLQALVASAPATGTVGGINRANWSFWRNQTENPSATPTVDTIRASMRNLWVKQVRNNDKPGLITASNGPYALFWGSLSEQQRFTGQGDMAKAGWDSLMFNSAEVVLDGGVDGSSPADTMYFLNTKYMKYRPHASRNMAPMNKDRYSVNQDAIVKLILFAGNLCMSNASLQGHLDAS